MSVLADPAFARPASAADRPEATFVSLANAERSSRGLDGLAVADDLVAVARRHAAAMAAANRIYHNPSLQQDVQSWQLVGENVGRGPTADKIHQAFMASATHQAEILQLRFTEVGVGTALAGGVLFVSEVFRQRIAAPAATPASAPAAAPAATTVPAPAPAASSRQSAVAPPVPTTLRAPRPKAAPVVRQTAPPATAPPATTPPPPADPLADALAAALAAAAGTRPDGVVEVSSARLSRSGSVPPSLPPLPVSFAGGLLLAVVAAQVRTTQRLRAATVAA